MHLSRLLACAASAPLAAAQSTFQIDPGCILVQDSSEATSGVFQLVKYSPSGALLDSTSLGLPPPFFGNMVGLTLIDGELWTIGTGALACVIDPVSGAIQPKFFAGAPGIEALTSFHGDLLIGVYGTQSVQRRKKTGELVAEFPIGVSMTGLATDGDLIYCGSYAEGTIYAFDVDGSLANVIPTQLAAYSLSGLAYDAASNSLWVTSGFGSDELHQYSLEGELLQAFRAGWTYVNDLTVVQSACVDLFAPPLAAASQVTLEGRASPLEPVALAVGLALGPPSVLAIGAFCSVSALSPALGVAQVVTLSDAGGRFAIAVDLPAIRGVELHVQAFGAGTCPAPCSSAVVSRTVL